MYYKHYIKLNKLSLIICLCLKRDGLLFKVENGKPKLIILGDGETSNPNIYEQINYCINTREKIYV